MDSKSGGIYFLEINSNCSVFYTEKVDFGAADEILTHEKNGHSDFLTKIIQDAFQTHAKQKPKMKVNFSKTKGFHSVAVEDLKPGQLVSTKENVPDRLVSKNYVLKCEASTKDAIDRFEHFSILNFAVIV